MTNQKTVSDDTLLQQIAAGDRGAFELFFRRHYTRVFQFVHRTLRRHDVVEEVVDDTFLVVWRSAASFAGQSAVTTWLLGIGYRQALKALERLQREARTDGDDDALDTVVDLHPRSDPQAAAEANELNDLLRKGVETLSETHRAALELAALGHSAPEIAEIVGCPEATVRTRLFHARGHLRAFLARAEGARSNVVAAPRRHNTPGSTP
jgi:RNA polymerase sigma-70 factor, ECF subfamily